MTTSARPERPLSLFLGGLAVAYLGSIILLSYRDGLTLVAKVVGVVLVASGVVSALVKQRPVHVSITYRLWGLWLVISVCTVILADRPEVAALKALTIVQVLPVALILTNLLLWHGSSRFYWVAIVVLALMSCALVWIDPLSFSDVDGRVFGPLGNANAFGAMLVTGFILVVVAALDSVRIARKVLWVVAAGIFFVMILRTGSRQGLLGSLIAMVVILASWAYQARSGRRHWLYAAIIAVTIVPLAVIVARNSEYWFRMEALLSAAQGDLGGADTSLLERARLYRRAAEIALQNPVFGVGLDNFRVQPRFEGGGPIGTYSHSNYAEILVGTGIVGFVLYFSAIALWIRTLYRARHLLCHSEWRPRYMRVVTVTVTYLTMDFATVSYYDKFVWLIFPWIIAELVSMERLHVVAVPRIAQWQAQSAE